MLLLASPQIQDYQVVQKARGDLHISLQVADGADFGDVAMAVERSVAATLGAYGCRIINVTIVPGVLTPEPGVKRRRVLRAWNAEAGPGDKLMVF
jgi:hypothetical protein